MQPEVLESHMVPMRDENGRGFERIVEHGSLEPCHHSEPCKEIQSDEAFKKLRKFEPGEKCREDINPVELLEERRVYKVLQLRGDWDSVVAGTPKYEQWEGKVVGLKHNIMPSQDTHGKQGMRNTSRKIETAEFYSSRWHRKRGGRTRGSGTRAEADPVALAEVLKELGL
jgi:hypothetical protein